MSRRRGATAEGGLIDVDRSASNGASGRGSTGRRKILMLFSFCAVVVLLLTVMPTHIITDSVITYTPTAFMNVLADDFGCLMRSLTGDVHAYESRIMYTVVCLTAGGALGLCGSTYQGAFNNPLAAPKTLGIMSGGALGALIYVLFFQQSAPAMPNSGAVTAEQISAWQSSLSLGDWLLHNYGQCFCSVIGCFLTVGMVMFVVSLTGRGRLSNITVIVAGQVFAVAVSSLIMFARYFYASGNMEEMADTLAAIENYTMVTTYTYHDLLVFVVPIWVCMVVVLLMRSRLNLLSFGDDEAYSMGMNVNRARYVMIALCTIMVALSISFCGHVAFLGFISAHISRRLVGPDFRYLLPASVLVGGTFLEVVEWLCSSGLPFTDLYAGGSICSIIGAAVFLFMAFREGRRGVDAWAK